VTLPTKDFGSQGELVAIGPGARLVAFAPADWTGVGEGADDCLALVTPDGADTPLLARLRPAAAAGALTSGARLVAHFAAERQGAMTDLWFEPV
jgi:hypothetical protein